MNTNATLLQINGALNVLRRCHAVAGTLPKKYEREMPSSSIAAAIRGLEIAKAELTGQPWPEAAPVADMSEYIDG
jgi:hypothetical protein